MCLLGEKTNNKDSPAYTHVESIFSFTDSSVTHKGDKDFGGSQKMIT